MKEFMKVTVTIIFTGPRFSEKHHTVLDLIEKEYKENFDYIILICPTSQWNKTYHIKGWIRHDDNRNTIHHPLYHC